MMTATGVRKNIADNSDICLLSDRDDIRVSYAVINEVGGLFTVFSHKKFHFTPGVNIYTP